MRFFFDGAPLEAVSGDSVAGALLRNGVRVLRTTLHDGSPRGYFCGMGVCNDCLVTVEGVSNVRACMTQVRDGMRVESQSGTGVRWPSS
jgi:predicted molibdopterin-dependent oxidoreductase YjgC